MRHLLLFLLLLTIAIPSQANTFDQANKYYTSKQYDKALMIYLDLAKKQEPTANLYYNIGNCYYRLNQLGYAILYYEKAYKIDPDDESIQKNLKIANSKIIDRITPISKIFIYRWLDNIIQLNSPNTFAIWNIILIWISIAFAILFFITTKSNIRKISFYSSIGFFVLFIISLWLGYHSQQYHQQTRSGVVVVKSVYVKSSPDPNSTDLFILHEGTKFEIQDNISDWYKIRLANGATGWVEEKNFGKI